MSTVLGNGKPIFPGAVGTGRLKRFATVDDVLEVLDTGEDPAELVALVEDAGATFLAPLEADLAGILCRRGDIESHLAIVSRDFRIPSLMGFSFADGDEPADGTTVTIDLDSGELRAG
jgi:phosphoenolpyruvate-protein kinase (PTS system EI component)